MERSVEQVIEVTGLACGYPQRTVLEGVGLDISAGETVALLGANGSGKTTLLKTLAGAIKPIAGCVRIAGQDLQSLPVRQVARLIGFVPQQEASTFDFSVREIVLMGRLAHSDGLFETPEDHEAAERAMERADCAHIADRLISNLSGGEAQRAVVARALAQEAPVLLLDEPTAHLDIKHQLEISQLLRSLAAEGYTVVAAVHDLNWAATFADRALLLAGGKIVEDAPMESLPDSKELARAYDVRFKSATNGDSAWRLVPTLQDR